MTLATITPGVIECEGSKNITRGEIIDIGWSDRKLKRSCSSDREGRRMFGAEQWTVLKRRIVSLEAAPTLAALEGVPGRFHELSADRSGQFSLDLRGAYRLIFTPDHDPVPALAGGGIDRSLVTKIVIVEVVDHHGR
jgi:plasmid maintenance system killer protein